MTDEAATEIIRNAEKPASHWDLKWEDVMYPLRDSALMPYIRKAGEILAVNHLHEVGDYDSGLSSSDINHTIYAIAKQVYMHLDEYTGSTYADKVLIAMVNEGGGAYS